MVRPATVRLVKATLRDAASLRVLAHLQRTLTRLSQAQKRLLSREYPADAADHGRSVESAQPSDLRFSSLRFGRIRVGVPSKLMMPVRSRSAAQFEGPAWRRKSVVFVLGVFVHRANMARGVQGGGQLRRFSEA